MSPEGSWGSLGESWEGPGALLEGLGGVPWPSWRGLGASGGDFGEDFLAMRFEDVFLTQF